MPRRPRLAAGDLAYHVLNRRVGRLPLFETSADYTAFEQILAEAHAQTRIRITAYCLMPTHWHLLLWPRQDGELSEVLRWIQRNRPAKLACVLAVSVTILRLNLCDLSTFTESL